jgi:hypothetical protein
VTGAPFDLLRERAGAARVTNVVLFGYRAHPPAPA